MTQPLDGVTAARENDELRRRMAIMEERWSTMEAGNGHSNGQAYAPGGKGVAGGDHTGMPGSVSNQYLARMTQYYTEGNQYRIANPGPLGLIAFGWTTAALSTVNAKWTEAGTTSIVYAFALLFGGLVQLLAGMWELYRNNVFGGTVFSSYGGFWLGYGIFGMLVSSGVFEEPTNYTHGLAMFLIIWGCLTFIFFIGALAINISLQVLLLSLSVTFFLLGAGEHGHPRVLKAGGYFGVWTAAVAWYIATAELMNSVYRRKILPLGVLNLANKEPSLTGVARPDTL